MENKRGFIMRNGTCIGMDVQRVYTSTPIGVIQPFASDANIPNGYLLCDGASYPTADYPDLYAVIGNTYGGDDTNFNVPNLIDKFIQGSNTSGTEIEAGLPNITGSIYGALAYPNIVNADGVFGELNEQSYGTYGSGGGGISTINLSLNASKSNAIYGNSDTVQPPALTMVYIIKAFHTNEGVDSGVSDDVVNYVALELKTSSNVDVTYVTLTGDSTFESMGDTYCKYQVKNGICYFQFFVSTTVATDTFTEIYNGLPKPTFSQYFSYSVYYNSQGLNKTLQVNISENGLLTAANTLPNSSYMIAGSYPIV